MANKLHQSLWAKWLPDGRYHPVLCHLIDVYSCAYLLWTEALGEGFRRWFAAQLGLDSAFAGKTISFWAGVHDIGKICPKFQRQVPEGQQLAQNAGFVFPPDSTVPLPHGVASAAVLADLLEKDCHVPPAWASAIAMTVGGHHGRFPNSRAILDARAHLQLGREQWVDARLDVFRQLRDVAGIRNDPAYPNARPTHAFLMALAGLTSVADWIGSAAEFFQPAGAAVNWREYPELSMDRARLALQALGWTGWTAPTTPLPFDQLFPFPPDRPLQQQAVRLAERLTEPSLVLVEAPMGEGKTEAAMYLADHWASACQQRGCYFALPTQATSNQMFGRVREFLERRYVSESVNLHLLHGYASLSEAMKELLGDRQSIQPQDIEHDSQHPNQQPGVVASEWFTFRKRGLLAPFGVGTVDQALMAILQTKHVFVRLFGLAHKTVIVDEVHAYDAYMSTLLERLLEWLRSLNCSVVLLSATLPHERRRRLLQAYTGESVASEESYSLYPRISYVERGQVASVAFKAAKSPRLTLRWMTDDTVDLGQRLQEALAEGGCAAVVCNTVGKAQETYRALRQFFRAGDELDLFHARFPFEDREVRERRTLNRFGKPSATDVDRPLRFVLVATQVIEQSLDIDFDLMVTELAPADLVLQRAGRLHRHARTRPAPFERGDPELWILDAPSGDDGAPVFGASDYVYSSHVLLRSLLGLKFQNPWENLKSRQFIRIPDDVEELIEAVYDDQRVCPAGLDSGVHEAWEKTRRSLDVERQKAEDEGRTRIIKRPGSSRSIASLVHDALEEDAPHWHQAFQAVTRLGDPTVTIVCLFETAAGAALTPGGRATDLTQAPDQALVEKLLLRAVRVAHRGVVKDLLENSRTPGGWAKSAWLRNHHAILFDSEGYCKVGQYEVVLDIEIGLTIRPLSQKGEKGRHDDHV